MKNIQEPATMKVEEAASYLGISRQMAYDLAREGKLPGAKRLGGRIIVSRQMLHEFLNDSKGTSGDS